MSGGVLTLDEIEHMVSTGRLRQMEHWRHNFVGPYLALIGPWTEQGGTADGLHTWLAALTAGSSEGNP